MQRLVLPDSSIYLAALRAGEDPFRAFSRFHESVEFATCGLIVLEVCRGIRDPELLRKLRERFATMIVQPTTEQVWSRAADLARSLDRQGKVLPTRTLMVAATALQMGATVLTTDTQFRAVPGLKVAGSLE